MTQNLKERLKRLLPDAADCELISQLAADTSKRVTFARLADRLKTMAEDLRQEIARHERQA